MPFQMRWFESLMLGSNEYQKISVLSEANDSLKMTKLLDGPYLGPPDKGL